jgi:hypothetical protein
MILYVVRVIPRNGKTSYSLNDKRITNGHGIAGIYGSRFEIAMLRASTRSQSIMKKRQIALSSLSVSISLATLLGVTSVARGDPPTQCRTGVACLLGVTYNVGAWYQYGQQQEPYSGPDLGYNIDYGTCRYDTSSPPVCGCDGVRLKGVYEGSPPFPNADPHFDSGFTWVFWFYDEQFEFQPGNGDCTVP